MLSGDSVHLPNTNLPGLNCEFNLEWQWSLSAPVTQGGVYVIKVVNLSLGPLQFTTTTTPLVQR